MTHVDDLHEPNDREPGEPEMELLDPEELLDAIDDPQVRATVEALLADHRYMSGLEKREEWAVTLGEAAPPTGPIQDGEYAEAALDLARKHKGQAWRRTLTVHPWEPISPGAPF